MEKLRSLTTTCIIGVLFGITTMASPAQTFTKLVNFELTNGADPQYVSLLQGLDGNFYGTTSNGGVNNCGGENSCGTIFKVTPSGNLTTLLQFLFPHQLY